MDPNAPLFEIENEMLARQDECIQKFERQLHETLKGGANIVSPETSQEAKEFRSVNFSARNSKQNINKLTHIEKLYLLCPVDDQCKQTFVNKRLLKDHIRQAHDVQEHRCLMMGCSESFADK